MNKLNLGLKSKKKKLSQLKLSSQKKIEESLMVYMNVLCVRAAQHHALAIGGMEKNI